MVIFKVYIYMTYFFDTSTLLPIWWHKKLLPLSIGVNKLSKLAAINFFILGIKNLIAFMFLVHSNSINFKAIICFASTYRPQNCTTPILFDFGRGIEILGDLDINLTILVLGCCVGWMSSHFKSVQNYCIVISS